MKQFDEEMHIVGQIQTIHIVSEQGIKVLT